VEIFEQFFNINTKIDNFLPRNLKLPNDISFQLIGARATGKSALILNYLSKKSKHSYLYIDCQDPAFIFEDINEEALQKFINEEGIQTLVLDHYFNGFIQRLPKVKQIVIVSREICEFQLPLYRLYPLDFSEFSRNNINSANFNNYTKKGSLPSVAISNERYIKLKEIFFEKFDEGDGKVLLVLALFNTKIATANQIYQKAKEHFKISKDWLYATLKRFEEEGVLYRIKKLESGFGDKIMLYDFAFAKYLNKYQTFINSFDSIVALALIKQNIDIVAISNPLGYLQLNSNILTIIAPFESEEVFWRKAQTNFAIYNQISPKEVQIVTISNSYQFSIKDINFKAIPFFEWIKDISSN